MESVPSDCKVEQHSYLQCQILINRIYKRAYEKQCLAEEFLSIMVAYSEHKFVSSAEVTTKIKETIFPNIGGEDEIAAKALFEYANEQMVELNLSDHATYYALYKKLIRN